MGRFVIRTVPTGVKFDLYAPNGQSILSSEVYLTASACRKGMRSVQKNAPAAGTEDQTLENSPLQGNPKFQVYTDKSGAFRFRLRAKNGQIIAVSEPYTTKAGCLGGIDSVRENAMNAQVEEALFKAQSEN